MSKKSQCCHLSALPRNFGHCLLHSYPITFSPITTTLCFQGFLRRRGVVPSWALFFGDWHSAYGSNCSIERLDNLLSICLYECVQQDAWNFHIVKHRHRVSLCLSQVSSKSRWLPAMRTLSDLHHRCNWSLSHDRTANDDSLPGWQAPVAGPHTICTVYWSDEKLLRLASSTIKPSTNRGFAPRVSFWVKILSLYAETIYEINNVVAIASTDDRILPLLAKCLV